MSLLNWEEFESKKPVSAPQENQEPIKSDDDNRVTGLEKLELSFNTPGLPGVNAVRDEGHPYHIYKIEGAQQDKTNPRAQYYQIYFCSMVNYGA